MAVNPADVCLPLLSIVNKDLLFPHNWISWLQSHDPLLHTTLAHFLPVVPVCLRASPSFFFFASVHTVICWPPVIRKQTGGLVWLPTASLQTRSCVCAWDIRSQTGLRFQGWCFSLCGIWAANVSVCVPVCVWAAARQGISLGCLRLGCSATYKRNPKPISAFISTLTEPPMSQNSVIHLEFRLHMAPQLNPFTMSFANLCVSPRWACSDDSSTSGRCFHSSRHFCFELPGKKKKKNTAFQRGSAAEKPWTSFTGTLSCRAGGGCRRTIGSCQGKNAGRHVPFIRLAAWLSACSQRRLRRLFAADMDSCELQTLPPASAGLTLTDFGFHAGHKENSWEFYCPDTVRSSSSVHFEEEVFKDKDRSVLKLT